MKRVSNFLANLIQWASVILFTVLLFSIFLAVLDRFLLHIGFFWTEELARFMFVWIGFLTASIMVQKRGHFQVSYFVEKVFSVRAKKIIELLITFILLSLMVFLLIYGFNLARFVQAQMSPGLRVSMTLMYASLPASAFFTIIFYVVRIIEDIKSLRSPALSVDQGETGFDTKITPS